jgi:hypothetical protein
VGLGEQTSEKIAEGLQLGRRQRPERFAEDFIDEPVADLSKLPPLLGESVVHGPSRTRDSFDEIPVDHACGERPEGLIALEGQLGKVVQGGIGMLIEVPQGVPLDEADPIRDEGGINRPVVPHLEALYGEPELLE